MEDEMANLFPDGDYTFKERSGATYDRGKVHYPALLRVELTERGAWLLVKRLINILDDPDGIQEGHIVPEITFVGTIERQDEDGFAIKMDGESCKHQYIGMFNGVVRCAQCNVQIPTTSPCE
jgi:hypothetical protein